MRHLVVNTSALHAESEIQFQFWPCNVSRELIFTINGNTGDQVLVSGDVMPVEKYPEIIAGITTADVQAAAKKLAASKLAMGAVGNLSSVPHLDAL